MAKKVVDINQRTLAVAIPLYILNEVQASNYKNVAEYITALKQKLADVSQLLASTKENAIFYETQIDKIAEILKADMPNDEKVKNINDIIKIITDYQFNQVKS